MEQLCCELLRSGSLECDCADDAGGSCGSPCVAGSPSSPLPAVGVEAPAAVAEAAEAVMSLLQGCSSAAAAAPALSGLFPSASTFEVALPAAAGGGHAAVPLLPAAGSAATVRCSAPAQLRPVVFAAARCTLTTPVPLSPNARQLLASFAAELGLALGQALKEQREVGPKAGQGQGRACFCMEGRRGLLAHPCRPLLVPALRAGARCATETASSVAVVPLHLLPFPPSSAGGSGPRQRGAAPRSTQGAAHPSCSPGAQLTRPSFTGPEHCSATHRIWPKPALHSPSTSPPAPTHATCMMRPHLANIRQLCGSLLSASPGNHYLRIPKTL